MTFAATHPAAASAPRGELFDSPVHAFLLAALLYLAGQAGGALEVWRTGAFIDTDDAMRLSLLRDFMAGKSWTDYSAPRLGGAEGFRTHWSHVIDLPLIALIKLGTLVADMATAERVARLVYPFATYLATVAALLAAARLMAGVSGIVAFALVAHASGLAHQFAAGRIDHHGAQILLLSAMTLAILRSLAPREAGWGALAGLAAALSFAISVENLPFIAVAGAIYAFLAAAAPERARAAGWFGAALALGTALGWAIFADREAGPICDAISTFHVALAALGGGGLAALAALAPRLSAGLRWAGLAALALAALALARLAFPACLGDPLAQVPPLMRQFWLSEVGEARPLTTLFAKSPLLALSTAFAILVGLAAALVGAVSDRLDPPGADAPTQRLRWRALAALIAVGFAATLWQVRAGTSATPLALIGVAALIAAAARAGRRRGGLGAGAPILAALALMPSLWTAVIPASLLARPPAPPKEICQLPAALEPLDRLPPSLILTSLDPGSFILAHTHHRAMGGAYHRNVRGNMNALEALLAPPDEARRLARAAGVDLVAACDGLIDLASYATERPGSLAALLVAHDPPAWLERVPTQGPWRVYRLIDPPARP